MASKRHLRRHQCERKEKHSKDEAFAIAVKMRRSKGQTLDAYQCPFCGNWHVGRRNRKVQQTISARRRAKGE